MIIKKNIEVGVDIRDCIGIYTDPENMIHILADRFEGKCYRGCFIKSINRILRIGECLINQDGVPGFGTIPVIMEVTAIVYAVGEILNGCVVQKKDKNGIIVCGTDIAAIMLIAHKSLESINKGQLISVRVGNVRYSQGSPKVSINAIPYIFNHRPMIYKIGNITEPVKILLSNVLERISQEEKEMELLKKQKARAWETFSQLLYAYKEEQKPPKGAIVHSLLDIVKNVDKNIKYISRDSRIDLSTPNVYSYTDVQADSIPSGAVVRNELPTNNVLIILLEDYCSHLRTIREMIDIYSTEELLSSHRNLWQIFKKNKL
ncbi:hypothetical protein PV-S19_0287 [Pacmanvirus S19]|nr:hypothetical protein PV-S19_0287 [Pacmanvirus S19]